MPRAGPDDEVVVGDVHFRVLEMRGTRIARVVVTHTPTEEEPRGSAFCVTHPCDCGYGDSGWRAPTWA